MAEPKRWKTTAELRPYDLVYDLAYDPDEEVPTTYAEVRDGVAVSAVVGGPDDERIALQALQSYRHEGLLRSPGPSLPKDEDRHAMTRDAAVADWIAGEMEYHGGHIARAEEVLRLFAEDGHKKRSQSS